MQALRYFMRHLPGGNQAKLAGISQSAELAGRDVFFQFQYLTEAVEKWSGWG
jgi:hypothetical protein